MTMSRGKPFTKNDPRRWAGRYAPEVINYIKANTDKPYNELSENINNLFGLNTTRQKVKSLSLRYGLGKYHCKPYPESEEVIGFIKLNYRLMSDREMSCAINKLFHLATTDITIKGMRAKYKIIKGTKTRCVTSENKTGKGYVRVKNPAGKWVSKLTFLWEQAHGKIPEGYIVIFLDCNKNNFSLDNLGIITRDEQIRLTKYKLRFSDPDLTRTGIAILKLNKKIKARRGEMKKSEDKVRKILNEIFDKEYFEAVNEPGYMIDKYTALTVCNALIKICVKHGGMKEGSIMHLMGRRLMDYIGRSIVPPEKTKAGGPGEDGGLVNI